MSQKGFSSVVIILTIVAVLTLIYILLSLGRNLLNPISTLPINLPPIVSPNPTESVTNISSINNWRDYNFKDFSLSVPSDWSSNILEEKEYYSFNGKSNLYVQKSDAKNIEEIIDDLTVYSATDSPQIKNITLGKAQGKEYYDCFGIEGCLKGYVVAIESNGKFYSLEYHTHSSEDSKEDIEIYNKIISSLKFH